MNLKKGGLFSSGAGLKNSGKKPVRARGFALQNKFFIALYGMAGENSAK